MINVIGTMMALCVLSLAVSCHRQEGHKTEKTAADKRSEASSPTEPAAEKPPAAEVSAPWGEEKGGLLCSIASSGPVVTPSKPVDLILRLRNQGNLPMKYHLSNCDGPTYGIQGAWSDGTALEFSDLLQQEHHPCGVTNWEAIAAGETRKHILPVRVGSFLGRDYLFIGAELGAPIERFGAVTLRLIVMGAESNPIRLNLEKFIRD